MILTADAGEIHHEFEVLEYPPYETDVKGTIILTVRLKVVR